MAEFFLENRASQKGLSALSLPERSENSFEQGTTRIARARAAFTETEKANVSRLLEANSGFQAHVAMRMESGESLVILMKGERLSGPRLTATFKVFELNGSDAREIPLRDRDSGENLKDSKNSPKALLPSPFPGVVRMYSDVGVLSFVEEGMRIPVASAPGYPKELHLAAPSISPGSWNPQTRRVETRFNEKTELAYISVKEFKQTEPQK